MLAWPVRETTRAPKAFEPGASQDYYFGDTRRGGTSCAATHRAYTPGASPRALKRTGATPSWLQPGRPLTCPTKVVTDTMATHSDRGGDRDGIHGVCAEALRIFSKIAHGCSPRGATTPLDCQSSGRSRSNASESLIACFGRQQRSSYGCRRRGFEAQPLEAAWSYALAQLRFSGEAARNRSELIRLRDAWWCPV